MGEGDGSLPHATIQRNASRRTRQLHFLAPNSFRFSEGLLQFNDSNNPLAVKLERENDRGSRVFSGEIFLNFISVEAAAASTTRIYSNDQPVEMCVGVFGVDGGDPPRRGHRGLFASPDRCPTQCHPITMPRGLPGALRQHPAGRQGVAAMLAAKHVEPLIGLPGSGTGRRSPGGAQSGNSSGCAGRVRPGR
jgi:hypothetical protein